MYELLVLDRNTWNHTTVCNPYALEYFIYNCPWKNFKKTTQKRKYKCTMNMIPCPLGLNNSRWVDMPLKSVNQSLKSYNY